MVNERLDDSEVRMAGVQRTFNGPSTDRRALCCRTIGFYVCVRNRERLSNSIGLLFLTSQSINDILMLVGRNSRFGEDGVVAHAHEAFVGDGYGGAFVACSRCQVSGCRHYCCFLKKGYACVFSDVASSMLFHSAFPG